MFTGIIETVGVIEASAPVRRGRRLRIEVGPLAGQCSVGASISVSGVCLTVSTATDRALEFDVVAETLAKSTLSSKRVGDRINIERAVRVGDRLDGHFVQGHVDGTGTVDRVQSSSGESVVWISPEANLVPYMIPKGAVAVDGVSLTIAEVDDSRFCVALIPTTVARTTLALLASGELVNIESDIIARTIVHRLAEVSRRGGLSLGTLREAGFA